MSGVRLGTFPSSNSRGGHQPRDERCPVCREPRRFHNAGGSVRAGSECTLPYGDPDSDAPQAEPAPRDDVPAPADHGDDDAAEGRPAQADAPAAPVTPRPIETRPADECALVGAAVVGGGDAVEEVAADLSPAATILAPLADFVAELETRAFYLARRAYCRSCVQWGPAYDQEPCPSCGGPMEPVWLATIPREVEA